FISVCCSSQKNAVETGKKILAFLEQNDSSNLAKLVDDDFILVQADGLTQFKSDFIKGYNSFTPVNKLSLASLVDKIIQKKDITILAGVLIQQWQEGTSTMR